MSEARVGFIGCGHHASVNLYPSLRLLGVQIAGVCAGHLDRAEAKACEWGAERAYDDYRALLRQEGLDAIFVAAPPELQAGMVKDCLSAGYNVFAEKPLGMNEREAADVADAAAHAGRHVMVGFMKRFAPAYVHMKRIVSDQGSFGPPLSLTGMFAIAGRAGITEEGYVKLGAVHYLDLLRFMFGDVEDISGYSNSAGSDVDLAISLRFAGGRIGNVLLACLPAWRRHYEELTITGVKGFVRSENMASVRYHLHGNSRAAAPGWQVMDEEDRVLSSIESAGSGGLQPLYTRGYVGEIAHFLECIAQDREPSSSAADNVGTMRLCDSVLSCVLR
jgi:UDP-N-acetylglucosamine 3-dehydrogenase